MLKSILRGLCSPYSAFFGHFFILCRRERQQMHQELYCSFTAIVLLIKKLLIIDLPVAVHVVGFLDSLLNIVTAKAGSLRGRTPTLTYAWPDFSLQCEDLK